MKIISFASQEVFFIKKLRDKYSVDCFTNMKISFAEKGEHHHHLGDVKIRLEAIAKSRISLAGTKTDDNMSTFKVKWQ